MLVVAVTAVGNATHTIEFLDAASGVSLRSFSGPNPVWGAPTVANGLVLYIDIKSNLTVLQAPGERADGGATDAGTHDAGTPDAGHDAGTPDAGHDAGTPDAGHDAGTPDGGSHDGGEIFADPLTGSGALGHGWEPCGGGFMRDGTDTDSTAARTCAVAAAPPVSNATATVDIQPSRKATYSGVIVRANPARPAKDNYIGYVNGSGRVRISRRNNGTYTQLGEASIRLDITRPHRIGLTVSGTSPVELVLTVDGAPAISVTDASPSRLVAPGKAGIYARDNPGAAFDHFVLTSP